MTKSDSSWRSYIPQDPAHVAYDIERWYPSGHTSSAGKGLARLLAVTDGGAEEALGTSEMASRLSKHYTAISWHVSPLTWLLAAVSQDARRKGDRSIARFNRMSCAA